MSTLHLACHHGDIKTVQILLEAGAEVDIRDQVCTFTSLYILVAQFASTFYCVQAEDTPLIYACHAGHSDIVAMLINDGADPNATNRVSII